MKILFCVDSLYSDLSKRIIMRNLNARVLKLSIPGAQIQELGLATANRVMAMNPKPDILLLSAGSNNTRHPIELFFKDTLKIIKFCISKKILFLMLPLPYNRYTNNNKIDEMNDFINESSYYKFELEYCSKDLAPDGLHLTDDCLLKKIKKIKKILNVAINDLQNSEGKVGYSI